MFFVGCSSDKIQVLNIPKLVRGITPHEAVNMAAWLLVMSQTVLLTADCPIGVDIMKALEEEMALARR